MFNLLNNLNLPVKTPILHLGLKKKECQNMTTLPKKSNSLRTMSRKKRTKRNLIKRGTSQRRITQRKIPRMIPNVFLPFLSPIGVKRFTWIRVILRPLRRKRMKIGLGLRTPFLLLQPNMVRSMVGVLAQSQITKLH